ncbi:MAG: serine/threonine protein kinase [Gemmatimonadetes bacterium]|nr:serine/threonine protein kinase [Gemmatimonadota bacterium]
MAPDAEFIEFQRAVAGRYSLERELGRGGMGIVYLAREVRLARLVAIKVLPRVLAAAKPELRERFVREAQTAAQLSHPHIVPIHHVDEAGEFVFFVMTFIDGETLGERLRARGPMKPADAIRMLREVGWALAYAHLRGIVHRDVKPDNILLERESGRALVSDFGIAGAADTPSTADGGYVRGTVQYLSPEQAAGEPVDGRSDLYSLGVVGYYAFSGRLPFDEPTATATMVAHLSKRPPALAKAAPGVPRAAAEAVERCLEKQPARRWDSGEQFAAALTASEQVARDIPAPIRVWLTNGNRLRGVRLAITAYFSMMFVAASSVSTGFLIGIPALALGLGLVPELIGLRRLLRLGYRLEDVHTALAWHAERRAEEWLYESQMHVSTRSALIVAAVGAATAAVAWAFGGHGVSDVRWFTVQFLGIGAAATGGMIAAVNQVRARIARSLGARELRFWRGAWGARFARLAGLGLKRGANAVALPQHTEVALGRATDALFESLPKALRKELREVPATVKRLEADAKALRERLDVLDDAIATALRVADDGGDPTSPSIGRSAGRDAEQLRARRDDAAERLSVTVTALENIRLGLLRLQLGTAPATSVTEAIQSASRIGEEIDLHIAADDEIAQALARRTERHRRLGTTPA